MSGSYKVIKVLFSDNGYEASLCVAVNANGEYQKYLINTYSSFETIRELLPIFYDARMKRSGSFCGLQTADGSVSAVFEYRGGESFTEFFRKDPALDLKDRLALADSLISGALELYLFDSRIAGRVILPDNAVVDKVKMKIYFNFLINPGVSAAESFHYENLGKMLCVIFPENRLLPLEIDKYISRLFQGEYAGCAAAYSDWREIQRTVEDTFAKYQSETFFGRLLRNIKERPLRKRKNKS